MSLFGAVWMADLRNDRPSLPIPEKNPVLEMPFYEIVQRERGKGELGMFCEPVRDCAWGSEIFKKKIRIRFSAIEVNH
jgi:hypothetical protein